MLKSCVFQVLDRKLGVYMDHFHARTYKKVIMAIKKCFLLSIQEINILFVKASRFIDKESVHKEKKKIETEVKNKNIAMGKPS